MKRDRKLALHRDTLVRLDARTMNRPGRMGLLVVFCGFVFLPGCRSGEVGSGLAPGTRLPDLLAVSELLNVPVEAPAPAKGWLLYAFSPASPASEANSDQVEGLAAVLPRGWSLLSVSVDDPGLEPFLERLGVTVPVLRRVPAGDLARYEPAPLPRTYVLDREWRLLEIVDGPYEREALAKLSRRLGSPLALPRVASTERASAAVPPAPAGASLCRDRQRLPYSPGATVEVFGRQFRCGVGGGWLPEDSAQ
jgi:hypothetical protein